MKSYFKIAGLVVSTLVLANCGHRTPPPIPKAIPVVETVVPHYVEVDNGITKSLAENARLTEKLKEHQKISQEQKQKIKEILDGAEKIKLQAEADQLISEIDAADLVDKLHSVVERNLFLEEHENDLLRIVADHENTLKVTKVKSSETLEKLLAKEAEANALRSMSESLTTNLQIQDETIKDLTKDLEKKQIEASKAGVYKNWVIGLVSAFILWLVIKNVLMIYFPTTKFRI